MVFKIFGRDITLTKLFVGFAVLAIIIVVGIVVSKRLRKRGFDGNCPKTSVTNLREGEDNAFAWQEESAAKYMLNMDRSLSTTKNNHVKLRMTDITTGGNGWSDMDSDITALNHVISKRKKEDSKSLVNKDEKIDMGDADLNELSLSRIKFDAGSRSRLQGGDYSHSHGGHSGGMTMGGFASSSFAPPSVWKSRYVFAFKDDFPDETTKTHRTEL